MLNYKKNKKAQVAQTVNWLIATIIIIAILIISISFSFMIAQNKAVKIQEVQTNLRESSIILDKKTDFAYELNNANYDKIAEILK